MAWAARNAWAAYLMEVLEPGELHPAAVIPSATGLVFALRLARFVVAIPLALYAVRQSTKFLVCFGALAVQRPMNRTSSSHTS